MGGLHVPQLKVPSSWAVLQCQIERPPFMGGLVSKYQTSHGLLLSQVEVLIP
jgi:hypothetical protein